MIRISRLLIIGIVSAIKLLCISDVYSQEDTVTFVQPKVDNYAFICNEFNTACREMTYSALMNKIDWFRSINDSLNRYNWVQDFEREIVDGYIEELITMTHSVKTVATSSRGNFDAFINYYYLFRIIKDRITDDLFYVEVVKRDDKLSVDGIRVFNEIIVVEEKYDFDELNNLKTDFQDKYKFELVIDELFNCRIAYGFNCHVDRWIPDIRTEIDEAVINNDQEIVLNFLKSTHLERQLYGIDGVHQLLNKNIDIDENILQLFEATRIRRGTVLYCDGHLVRQKHIMGVLYHIKNWYDTADERE